MNLKDCTLSDKPQKSNTPFKSSKSKGTPGYDARKRALDVVARVLDEGQPLEYLLDRNNDDAMPANDRALARAIAATTLRRKGQIDRALGSLMQKPLGRRGGGAMHILRIAAAQILFMEVPDHASVSIAMDIAKSDHKARHFSKLINGVLRAMTRQKEALLADMKARDILPEWLARTWDNAYGRSTCDAMASALSHEPYLDISVKPEASDYADKLGGELLPNGSVRLKSRGMVSDLVGFKEGDWWVQDMAASLAPALLGDVSGKRVADLCAAPGGKSAYLAARGANVTAVDVSAERLKRLDENLNRLQLSADVIEADIEKWMPDALYDCVLLDAPCSATGTARRHPDILWLKSPELVERLVLVQRSLLKRAVDFLKPGGTFVFCTCSLQPEEGEAILDFVKQEALPLELIPIMPQELGGFSDILRPDGSIRTRPDNRPLAQGVSPVANDLFFAGLDGFFMAKFQKNN
ncbi:MAG: transcription antitermination factor NusB [Hyphomicrobiales bacterium]